MIVKRAAIPKIVQHHLEEAVFLWQLRQRAVLSAEYTLDDLAGLDERLQAHLEGLLSAVEDGWQLTPEALEQNGPGAVFASTWLWLKQGEADKVIALVEQTAQQPRFYSALLAAFGRATPASLKGIVRSLLMFPSGTIKQVWNRSLYCSWGTSGQVPGQLFGRSRCRALHLRHSRLRHIGIDRLHPCLSPTYLVMTIPRCVWRRRVGCCYWEIAAMRYRF